MYAWAYISVSISNMNESMLIHSSDSPFFSYKGDLSLGQHVSVHSPHPLPKKKEMAYDVSRNIWYLKCSLYNVLNFVSS